MTGPLTVTFICFLGIFLSEEQDKSIGCSAYLCSCWGFFLRQICMHFSIFNGNKCIRNINSIIISFRIGVRIKIDFSRYIC